jgi:hypothetical protein
MLYNKTQSVWTRKSQARVVKLVNTADLKSAGPNQPLPVRFRFRAPNPSQGSSAGPVPGTKSLAGFVGWHFWRFPAIIRAVKLVLFYGMGGSPIFYLYG